MAAISDPAAAESPDAYAARMAAMQRALGTSPVAGYTGPAGPGSGAPNLGAPTPTPGYSDPNGGGVGGLFAGPGGSPAIAQPPTKGPAGTPGSLAPAGMPQLFQPGQTPGPASGPTSAPQGPDAMQRALNAAQPQPVSPQQAASNGSVGTVPQSPATVGGSVGSALIPKAPVSPVAAAPVVPNTPTEPTGAGSSPIDTGASGAGGVGSLQGLTGSIMQQIQGIQSGLNAPGTPIDVTAVYLKQSQSILDMLNQQEASLRAEAQKQGTQIDPATQFTIDKLRETLDANLKSTREDLNRRGLYDSGILLQLENNLQKGSASDQAQILATRLSKLQQDLQTGLTNIGNQKFQTASQFGLAGANAQTASDSQGRTLAQQREQQALQAMLSLRGQQSGEQQAAASLAQQNAQFNSSQAFTAQQNALQRAAAAASTAAGRTTTGATGGSGTTGGNGTTNSGGDVRVQQAITSLVNTYNNREDATAAIVQQGAMLASTIGAAGIAALEAAANALPSKASVSGNIGGGTRS